jgi:hypothetical protein
MGFGVLFRPVTVTAYALAVVFGKIDDFPRVASRPAAPTHLAVSRCFLLDRITG